MSEAGDANLRVLHAGALELSQRLDRLAATTADFRSLLAQSLEAFRRCRELSDSLALFSRNESVDDVATGDLQYLSIDFHIAELLAKSPTSGPTARTTTLREAQDAYGAFLDALDSHDLLAANDKKLLERWQSDRDGFELVAAADPAARRGAKIARYQEEKALKEKLQYLQSQSQTAEDDADSMYRDLYLAQLGFNVHKSFQALDSMAQELKILTLAPRNPLPHAVRTPETDGRLRQPAGAQYSERVDPSMQSLLNAGSPLLDKKGKPMQPFVLHDARSKLREGVFRSGHRLPTMTIDEYLEAERARGGIIEGGGEASGRPKEVDEDDFEAADRETEKQRAWDEFKEENPKGSGNTLNRG